MKHINACIWFDNEAENAANFYVSVFPDSRIIRVDEYLTETPSNKPLGSVMSVSFVLGGVEFMTLNGGPFFKANEAISFIILCDNQEEIDYFYDKLSFYPESEMCGWIKDKFGVSWQLITSEFDEIMDRSDDASKKRVMDKLLSMKRINIKELKKASNM
jgi:predicted 3-demethylubiquinone-9 3-methyltransferase (glyoxalase superfamily)